MGLDADFCLCLLTESTASDPLIRHGQATSAEVQKFQRVAWYEQHHRLCRDHEKRELAGGCKRRKNLPAQTCG